MRHRAIRLLLAVFSVLICIIFTLDLLDLGSFGNIGFDGANRFVKIVAFVQTQTIGFRLFALCLVYLIHFDCFKILFIKDLASQLSVTTCTSKTATARNLALLAILCACRFITETVVMLQDPTPTASFAVFTLNSEFVRAYYALYRFLGSALIYGADALFVSFALLTADQGKRIVGTARSLLDICSTDDRDNQTGFDVWMLCRSYFVFATRLRFKRDLFRIALLIQITGALVEFMSAVSWFAMFVFSSDLSLSMGVLRRILTGSWTLIIIPAQFWTLLSAAVPVTLYHYEMLATFDKIVFWRKNQVKVTDIPPQEQSSLRVLEMIKDSKRPHGFSIGGMVEINRKVLSVILVSVFGYITFAVDRMESAQISGLSQQNPMKVNLTSCHQASAAQTIYHSNVSCSCL